MKIKSKELLISIASAIMDYNKQCDITKDKDSKIPFKSIKYSKDGESAEIDNEVLRKIDKLEIEMLINNEDVDGNKLDDFFIELQEVLKVLNLRCFKFSFIIENQKETDFFAEYLLNSFITKLEELLKTLHIYNFSCSIIEDGKEDNNKTINNSSNPIIEEPADTIEDDNYIITDNNDEDTINTNLDKKAIDEIMPYIEKLNLILANPIYPDSEKLKNEVRFFFKNPKDMIDWAIKVYIKVINVHPDHYSDEMVTENLATDKLRELERGRERVALYLLVLMNNKFSNYDVLGKLQKAEEEYRKKTFGGNPTNPGSSSGENPPVLNPYNSEKGQKSKPEAPNPHGGENR
ncbi:MAG: hypothetical protein J5507_01665 [Clostridia bacterium]|nr:hypothetical protein [Clostridia bacterium]